MFKLGFPFQQKEEICILRTEPSMKVQVEAGLRESPLVNPLLVLVARKLRSSWLEPSAGDAAWYQADVNKGTAFPSGPTGALARDAHLHPSTPHCTLLVSCLCPDIIFQRSHAAGSHQAQCEFAF
jgi:hypothetical protein